MALTYREQQIAETKERLRRAEKLEVVQSSWETYTKCDPRPDAASEKALNTFLSQGADEEARANTTESACFVAHSWFVYVVVVAVVVMERLVVLVLLPMLLRLWLTVHFLFLYHFSNALSSVLYHCCRSGVHRRLSLWVLLLLLLLLGLCVK